MVLQKDLKRGSAVVALSVAFLLSGCSKQENPLHAAHQNVSADFLVRASRFAEKKLKVFNPPGGYYYGQCMMGKEKPTLCNKLYKAMANFGNTTKQFKGITVSELTNQVIFNQLKGDYERIRFNAI